MPEEKKPEKAAAAPKKEAAPAAPAAKGKGLDIGTANLVAALEDANGDIVTKRERNAFIDVAVDNYTKNMLTKLKVPYVMYNKKMYVLGEHAFELANVLNKNTRRPMADGMISPQEADALPVMRMLIETLLGASPGEECVCYYSVPADPIDSDLNVVYHKEVFEGVLRSLNYTPRDMIEGHAVVFSELSEDDFTGIGISCGGGMFNISVSYKTLPALTFSTSRAGDWVDKNVANVLGIKPARATMIKEKGVDLTSPKGREEEAIVIYYRNLINYTLESIKSRFESSDDMPSFPDAVAIVCGGGTSMIGGFIDIFKEEFDKVEFPLDVKDIRLASDPFHAVAKGCLMAALTE